MILNVMGNRKAYKRPGHRIENDKTTKKKSLDVSEKYSESLIDLNESSFKIRRFMNDLKTYKENPSLNVRKTRHESELEEKENAYKKFSHATLKAKSRHEIRGKVNGESKSKFSFQGKKGLFENGVATKPRAFNKGLMPPMWNARLNADLRSILNLACVDAQKRHAPSTPVAESIDDASESLRSRSPDATLINSRLAKATERKKSSPKRLKKHKLTSIFKDDDDEDDESLVHASCSQVGGGIVDEERGGGGGGERDCEGGRQSKEGRGGEGGRGEGRERGAGGGRDCEGGGGGRGRGIEDGRRGKERERGVGGGRGCEGGRQSKEGRGGEGGRGGGRESGAGGGRGRGIEEGRGGEERERGAGGRRDCEERRLSKEGVVGVDGVGRGEGEGGGDLDAENQIESDNGAEMSDNDFPLEAKSSDPASVPVNFSDYYIQFAHCAIKNLTLTRLDREELENTSKRPVRFLARFYHKRRTQISEGQKEEEDSSSFLAKEISQSKEKLERSLPIQYGAHTVKTDTFSRITRRAQPSEEQGGSESSSFLSKYGFQSKENVKKSQPVQYGANTIRSDEWPRISRMRAQADEQFNDASVTSKNKLYKSGLELLEAVYGPNPGNEKQKTLNHLSVTPPKCTFSPISGDISSISAPFVNPVNGKRDWLPAFKSTSPPVTKPCVCYKSGSCDFMSCDDDLCQNNVINYDFMSARNGVNEQGLGRFEFMTVGNGSSQQNIGKKDFMISGNGSSQQKVGSYDFVTHGNSFGGKSVGNDNFMTVGNSYNLQNSGNNGFITHGNSSSRHQIGNYKFMTVGNSFSRQTTENCELITCGNGGKPSKSCLVNDARVKNSDDLETTLGRSRTAVSTADCLTILPPKSERWGASGLETKLKIKLEDTSDDRKDFLTIPLRPRETARESPDILYYPRRMF